MSMILNAPIDKNSELRKVILGKNQSSLDINFSWKCDEDLTNCPIFVDYYDCYCQ